MLKVDKETPLEILISLGLGAVGLGIAKLWPYEESSVFVEICSFIFFFIFTYLFLLQLKILKRSSQFNEVKNELSQMNLILKMVQDAPKAVHNVMVRYSRRFFGDLCSEKTSIYVENYVQLLEESLDETNKKLLATSLITPEKWLSDKEYKRYFDLQLKKKKTYPEIDFSRIFILKMDDFKKQESNFNELAKMHIDAGIRIGYCYEENLKSEDVRDLVQFQTNNDVWIIDAGKIPKDIPSTDKKTIVEAQFQYTSNYLDNRFRHWLQNIENTVTYVDSNSLPIKFK